MEKLIEYKSSYNVKAPVTEAPSSVSGIDIMAQSRTVPHCIKKEPVFPWSFAAECTQEIDVNPKQNPWRKCCSCELTDASILWSGFGSQEQM